MNRSLFEIHLVRDKLFVDNTPSVPLSMGLSILDPPSYILKGERAFPCTRITTVL